MSLFSIAGHLIIAVFQIVVDKKKTSVGLKRKCTLFNEVTYLRLIAVVLADAKSQ
jgi:hypothetical protein